MHFKARRTEFYVLVLLPQNWVCAGALKLYEYVPDLAARENLGEQAIRSTLAARPRHLAHKPPVQSSNAANSFFNW